LRSGNFRGAASPANSGALLGFSSQGKLGGSEEPPSAGK
jgi:hypothetical protein